MQAALGLVVGVLLVLIGLGLAEKAQVVADRRAERAAVVAGAREAVDAGVKLAADLRDKFRFADAQTALDQVAAQIPDDAPVEMQIRVAEDRTNLALARELDEIRFSRIRGGDPIKGAEALPGKYRAAFQSHGLDPTRPDTAVSVAEVRGSKIRHQIIIGAG